MSDRALAFRSDPPTEPATAPGSSSPSIAKMLGLLPIETVIRVVCAEFLVTREKLLSHDRHQPLSLVRQIAIHVARRTTGASYPSLGREFGGRDHTTIMSADRAIARRCLKDARITDAVERLIREVEEKA